MARDYSSFTTLAKRCFRPVADELSYEQISGVVYVKRSGDWFESFNLQVAGHGNDFFYVNYGILAPDLYPSGQRVALQDCGMILSSRLRDSDDTGGFGRLSKADVQESASRVLDQYRAQARPWFDALSSWPAIAEEYLRISPIDENKIGRHTITFGADLRSATYGYLLLKANQIDAAARWLREAERLMRLPVYYTRDGRTVHEKEKFARLQKPDPEYLETLRAVQRTLTSLAGAT
jgi:hypothetical protein